MKEHRTNRLLLGRKNRLLLQKIEQKQVFRKIFLSVTMGMLAVVLFIFAVVSSIAKDMITEQNIEKSSLEFFWIQEKFEEQNRLANMLATQILLDELCADFLFVTDSDKLTDVELMRIRRRLSNYQNSNDVVDSIYLYNGRIDKFVNSNSGLEYVGKDVFKDQGIVRILEDLKRTSSRNLFKRERQEGDFIYTCILNNIRGETIENAIVVNLNLRGVFSKGRSAGMLEDSHILIMDSQGDVVVEAGQIADISKEEIKALMEEMKQENKAHTEYRYEGQKYFVSYLYSEATEFDYMKITKWEKVFDSVNRLRLYTFLLSVLIIIVVIIGSVVSTTSIYRLHRQMAGNHTTKNRIKVSEKIQLKERFLNEFLHKMKLFGKQQLMERFAEHGHQIAEGEQFSVLILQLEGYSQFIDEFGLDGAYDIKYGFRNIFEEIFSVQFYVSGLINRDNTLIFLISQNDGQAVDTNKIEADFQKFCKSVQPFVDWKFALIGTEQSVTIEKIPGIAEQLYEVKNESFFYPSNTFLTYERLKKEHNGYVDLMKLDSSKLLGVLHSGEEQLTEQYRLFTDCLRGYASSEYMNAVTWLGVSIVRNLKDSYMGEEAVNDFLERLSKCEKKEAVDEVFLSVFADISQMQKAAGEKKGVTGKVEEVQAYIKEHYADSNITLDYLGDEFGVSANYLGRVFKKETGVSVSEYLNNERLQYVLHELEYTEKPAKDIAEECGFMSTNYFYTYFKKKVGVSPVAYRENKRKKE